MYQVMLGQPWSSVIDFWPLDFDGVLTLYPTSPLPSEAVSGLQTVLGIAERYAETKHLPTRDSGDKFPKGTRIVPSLRHSVSS